MKKPETVLLPSKSKATWSRKSVFVFQAIWKKVVPKSKFWTRKKPKRYYFYLRAKQLWIEKLSYVPSNLKKSSSKIKVLNKKKPETVLPPAQSKAAVNQKAFLCSKQSEKKVVPKSTFWTWKSPKQYYFQVKAKQLGVEKAFLCSKQSEKKIVPKSKFWTWKSPKQYYFQVKAKQLGVEKTFLCSKQSEKKVVPKSKFWTRKSPKRYYFQLRAKQLWIEKLSCVPSNLKKK